MEGTQHQRPDQMSSDLIAISELFTSIQGEGVSAGTPSFFIRLQGCSVGCVWCDTKYAWPPNEGRGVHLDDLIAEAKQARVRNVVITGGEPLETAGIATLVTALRSAGFRIEIETAGILPPLVHPPVDQWNVSLKLRHSNVPQHRRINPAAIRGYLALPAWFKFVMAGPEDLDEILELQREFEIPSSRVLLMPLGATRAVQHEVMGLVAKICVEHGFRFSPRLHSLIWGAQRGV